MEKTTCPKCDGIDTVKNGYQNNLQRYQCKICNKNFQVEYTHKAYKGNINRMLVTLFQKKFIEYLIIVQTLLNERILL